MPKSLITFLCNAKSFVIACVIYFMLLVNVFRWARRNYFFIFFLNAALIATLKCPLEINSNGGLKGQDLKSSTSTIKTLNLQEYNAYGHQALKGCDLP